MSQKRPDSIEELLELKEADQERWFSLMSNTAEADKTPELRRWAAKIGYEWTNLALKPPETLSPTVRAHQSNMIKAISAYEEERKNFTPAQVRREAGNPVHQFGRAIHMEAVMKTCPPTIRSAQEGINKLLIKDHEGLLFDVPGLLNCINAHLGRPPRFNLSSLYTPGKEDLTAQLIDIYVKKPEKHAAVIKWLILAAMFEQPPHPTGCTCPLCAHITSVTQQRS